MSGLYIHIPFCASRCIYCGFSSTTLLRLQDDYVDALCKEMTMRQPTEPVQTVYLGGGTPSLLSKKNLEKLFACIAMVYGHGTVLGNFQPNNTFKEITIECNPDDVTEELAQELIALGINRVSIGAQTFSPRRLKFIHRRHTAEQIKQAVRNLRMAGFKNISIDLMFGFPGETLQEWIEDIREALALQVEHISAYSLMYEDNTPLTRLLKEGKIHEINDELSLEMYKTLIELLNESGYEQYEISNFAKLVENPQKGEGRKTDSKTKRMSSSSEGVWDNRPVVASPFRSRHNSSYWHEIPYIGIGASAHSYDLKSRQWNIADLRQYIQSIQSGKVPCEKETLDLNTRYDDLITTALRTREGIDLKRMEVEYGKALHDFLLKCAEPYLKLHDLKITDQQLSLTRGGLYISNEIMSDLMHV